MKVKKFKNGNINVKGYKDTIEEIENLDDLVELLCNSIELDYVFIDRYSFVGYELYNANIDKMCCISQFDFETFKAGNVLKFTHYDYDKTAYEDTDIYEYLN